MNSKLTGKGAAAAAEDQFAGCKFASFEIVTFEHRHENKSCSACPKDQF